MSTYILLNYIQSLDDSGLYKEADEFDNLIKIAQRTSSDSNTPPLNNFEKNILNFVDKQNPLVMDGIFASLDVWDLSNTPHSFREYNNWKNSGGPARAKQSLLAIRNTLSSAAKFSKPSKSAIILGKDAIKMLSSLFPKLRPLLTSAKMVPFLGILFNLWLSKGFIEEYVAEYKAGTFYQNIWNDPDKRALFIENVLMLTAAFLVLLPPPANAVGGVFYSIASASSLGRMAVKYGVKLLDNTEVKEKMGDFAELSLNPEIINFNEVFKNSDIDVKEQFIKIDKYVKKYKDMKLRDILSVIEKLPEMKNWYKKYPIISKNDEVIFKNNQMMQLINERKNYYLNKSIMSEDVNTVQPHNTTVKSSPTPYMQSLSKVPGLKPLDEKPSTVKPPSDKKNINKPTTNISIPTTEDIEYYVGWGYNAFERTHDYNRSLNELKRKLKADKKDSIYLNKIIVEFNNIFKQYLKTIPAQV